MSINTKLEQLNQKLVSGKTLLAAAITDKGIKTEKTETLESMAGKVGQIEQGSGGGLEPGSTIPVDMLIPPKETQILQASNKTNPTNFIIHTDTHILFTNGYSDYIYSFNKATKQIKSELNGYRNFLSCIKTSEGNFLLYCKRDNTPTILVIDNTFNVLLEKQTSEFPSGSPTVNMVEMGDSYYILFGSYISGENKLYKVSKSDLEFTFNTINAITGNSNEYYYNIVTYENHLFILGQKDFIKIDSNMTMVSISTDVKANSSNKTYFNMHIYEGFFYLLPYNFMNSKIFKVNPSDLTFTQITFKSTDGSPAIKQIDNYCFIHGDKTIQIYGLDLSFKKTITLVNNFVSVSIIDHYLLLEDVAGNINLYDIDMDFKLKWSLPYPKDGTYTGDSNCFIFDFNKNYRLAYLADGKIYLFRCGVYSIDVEPKYTIKAETLANMPDVMKYLISNTPTTLEEK